MVDELQDDLPDVEETEEQEETSEDEVSEEEQPESEGEAKEEEGSEEDLSPEEAEKETLAILEKINPERAAAIREFLSKGEKKEEDKEQVVEDEEENEARESHNFTVLENRAEALEEDSRTVYSDARDRYYQIEESLKQELALAEKNDREIDPKLYQLLEQQRQQAYAEARKQLETWQNAQKARGRLASIRKETDNYPGFRKYRMLYTVLRANNKITDNMDFDQRRAVLNQALIAQGRKPIGTSKAEVAKKNETIKSQLKKLGNKKVASKTAAVGQKAMVSGKKGGSQWKTKDPDALSVLNRQWE